MKLATGAVTVEPASRGDVFAFDGQQLVALFGPRWRLLIIGAGQLSRVVAQMALALDFEVICCDPRDEYNLTWDIPGTTFSKAMPDDLVIELQLDPHSAVVAVTHDPKLDDLVLLDALKSPAFYIGALGSRNNTAARRERHERAPPIFFEQLVVAEIVAVKNGVLLKQKKDGSAVPAIRPATSAS